MTHQTRRYMSASIALTLSILLFTAVPVSAQTVAEAARRERERKKTSNQLHVYTNEDLAKAKILVPADEARAERNSNGADSAQAATVAPGAMTGNSKGPAANAAILETSAPAAVSPKDRKEAAASVIAATPNVQVIDSYFGSMVLPVVAATRPSFPAEANGAAPLFTPKGQIALPQVNLPQVTPDADPRFDIFDAPLTINFPGGAAGNSTSVRAASPERAPAVPVVSGARELPPPIEAAIHPLLTIPGEPATTAAVKSRPAAEAIETEAPSMPSLLALVGVPPSDAPLDSPVAPEPRADNPIQLPAQTFEGSAVTVQRGDSLWKLAERFLGDGERWPELAKINPQLANPSLIHPGDPIHLPSLPVPGPLRGDLKNMVVRRGDTLWRVAQAEFGQPLALNCIAKANQLSSVDVIRVGQTLVLPEACGVSQ